MLRGYYTSVNGILNEERILNVITNNLSNTNTAGYKSDAAIPTTFHDNLVLLANGKVSSGEIQYRTLLETKTSLESGTFEQTDSRLDMAVMGSVYFNIQRRNSGEVLLTRNGQFNIDNEGYLALGSAGRVIDNNGNPIQLGTANFTVREDGLIQVDDGREIQLALTYIPDNSDIEKVDTNLMRPYEDTPWGNIPEGMVYRIRQGWYERSNVNVAAEMAKAIDANALFRANSQALQIINSVNQLAVNNLMKV